MTSLGAIHSSTASAVGQLPKKELGKEDFLKILVTQLQNQDPTQPMQDAEFVQQTAQLSTLEQITNLNQAFTAYIDKLNHDVNQYTNMIGKKVTWVNPETNQQESGIVTGIIQKADQIYVKTGEQEVPADAISSVEM
jgi:flagellar basal-body rod modification protein FlgD